MSPYRNQIEKNDEVKVLTNLLLKDEIRKEIILKENKSESSQQTLHSGHETEIT
jgi:hypothetical protein